MAVARAEAAALCPVCAAPTRIMFDDLYDDRYGYPGVFLLRQCSGCGHLHIPASFTPKEMGSLYTNYYPRGTFDIDSFRPEEERRGFFSWLNGDRSSAFRWVPRDVQVLDVGCGVGQTLAFHRNRGCVAVGMEADENVQPIARRFGLDIRQGVFDGTQFPQECFDCVTLDQVAEHALDPLALFKGITRVLKRNGTAILTTPNPKGFGAWLYGRRWLNWHVPYHLQFYSHRSLALAAERAGLVVEHSSTRTASDWQYFQWQHARLFAPQGVRSNFWSGQTVSVPFLTRLALRLKLHCWISRILDALGLGDNRVIVLRKP